MLMLNRNCQVYIKLKGQVLSVPRNKPTSKNTAKSIVMLILLLICCAAITYLTISLRRNRIEEPIGEATTPANTKKKDVIIEENTGRRRINLKR